MILCVLVSGALLLLNTCYHDSSRDGASSTPSQPSVSSFLLITIDTWRWDYVGAAGTEKVETPHLDSLAGEGLYVREALTTCPLTTPAHASILTGNDILNHGVMDCSGYNLDNTRETLAEAFHRKGYSTAAFVSSETLNARYGLNRGFDVYNDICPERVRADEGGGGARRDGQLTLDAALDYIRNTPENQKLFLWVHFYDLHMPYAERPGIDSQYPGNPYASQVAYTDQLTGQLILQLRKDKKRSWKMVIVGDHGEGLGDKDEPEHGMGIYRSTLHVPLIFFPRPPISNSAKGPWGLVDLAPTIKGWVNLSSGIDEDGINRILHDRVGQALVSLTVLPSLMFGANPVMGIRKDEWMYIRHGGEELYNSAVDPYQQVNRVSSTSNKQILRDLRGECARNLPLERIVQVLYRRSEPTTEEEKKLKSLGYIGAVVPKGIEFQRATLSQILSDWNLLYHARKASRNDPSTLPDVIEPLIRKYPKSATLAKEWGNLLARQGRIEESLEVYERVLKWNSTDVGILSNMGALYAMSGRGEEAERAFKAALVLREDNPVIHKNLGNVYATLLNKPDQAVFHYQRCLELEPSDSEKERLTEYMHRHEKLQSSP